MRTLAGIVFVGLFALSACGDDGTDVEIVAFAVTPAELGDVVATVNGETEQLLPSEEFPRNTRTSMKLSGDIDIRIEIANASDTAGVVCGINGLPEVEVEFAEYGEESSTCHLVGNIDDSTFEFTSEKVMRVVDSTDPVTTPLDAQVDADLFTVRIPAEWESTAVNYRIDNGTPDPGGLDLEILMTANNDLDITDGTLIRIDRAIDRGDVDLEAWNQRFLDDLAATDTTGKAEFSEPTLVSIGEFNGYAARSDGESYFKTFAFEQGGDLIMISARHNFRPSPEDVSLESIIENLTVN